MKAIAVLDEKRGIGKNGGLLFSLPEDMKFFREKTAGKVVVMGRKTLESFPGGRPLKNRVNVVLTSDKTPREGCVLADSLSSLREILKEYQSENVFVVGGAKVYEELLPYCDEAFLTMVFADGGADSFFPPLGGNFTLAEESEEKKSGDLRFRFTTYKNNSPLIL